MRYPAKNIVITILCSLVLFIIAVNCYAWLSDLIVPRVDGAIYDVTILTSPFEQSLPFACLCAAVPAICLFLWRRIPVTGISKQLASAILIISCMAGAVMIRRQFFSTELKGLTNETKGFRMNPQVPAAFDNFNIEYWMLIGLIAGAALTFLFFRKKQKNGQRKRTN